MIILRKNTLLCGIILCICLCLLASPGSAALPYGKIVAWGSSSIISKFGTPPAGNDFTNVSTGEAHALALRSDGSIAGWGVNLNGQATPLSGNDFIAVAAGNNFSLALQSNGSIAGWGNNQYGKAIPPAGTDFTAIAAGRDFGLALKSDGSIVGWGLNDSEQLATPAGAGYLAIAAGAAHGLALRSNGSIVAWGKYPGSGSKPNPPPGGDYYTAISGAYRNSVALCRNGTIVQWGTLFPGLPTDSTYIAISAGSADDLALGSNGTIVTWSDSFGGNTPPSGNNFTAISAGEYYFLAIEKAFPAITALSPSYKRAKSSGFKLAVKGTGFVPGSQIQWNGTGRATTYVTPTKLTTKVTAKDIRKKGKIPVTVLNPDPLSEVSNVKLFKIK
jgi:hypothetical protein